jgi:hypothetical protein
MVGLYHPHLSLQHYSSDALYHTSLALCLTRWDVTGPAHWCKTEAGGFGHNFVNDYQRAAIKIVGIWHTPLHCDALQVVEIVKSYPPSHL